MSGTCLPQSLILGSQLGLSCKEARAPNLIHSAGTYDHGSLRRSALSVSFINGQCQGLCVLSAVERLKLNDDRRC